MKISTRRMDVLAQYGTSANLSQRVNLHRHFSTSRQDWGEWLFEQLDFAPGARILDVGCGTGRLWAATNRPAERDWQPCLTDLSRGMVAEARANLQASRRYRFACTDIQQLPFADSHFDGVLSCHMLYHVPDRHRALAEMSRVLRPGGKLYAATNGSNHLREFWDCLDAVAAEPVREFVGHYFGLENGGEQLAAHFDDVALTRRDDSLLVPDVEPLMAYARSTGRLTPDQLHHIEQVFSARLASGPLHIQKDVGLFRATRHGH